ncbi:MAG TPA: type 1 glutamine amidotransferase domain-containing protein [Caulobacteraceae bacterium]|nr:type 1 glutamine amidotransferase domain-containing protein [Caulobacteraceae bacterium]
MSGQLEGKKIAIMATDGVEEVELTKPMQALKEAGAQVEVVSPKDGEIQGFNHLTPGDKIKVDRMLNEVEAADYDALVLPGGVANPDQLRVNDAALDFVRSFAEAGKPMGVICHAPWILINAGLAEGRTLTGWETIRQDLTNAGAIVVDQEVVVDNGLVTSRGPKDLPAFCSKIIEEFREGLHEGQRRAALDDDGAGIRAEA